MKHELHCTAGEYTVYTEPGEVASGRAEPAPMRLTRVGPSHMRVGIYFDLNYVLCKSLNFCLVEAKWKSPCGIYVVMPSQNIVYNKIKLIKKVVNGLTILWVDIMEL